jgi:hypothetical protein
VMEQEGRKGFIDRSGKLRIAPKLTWAYSFQNKLEAACGASFEQCGYVDTNGRGSFRRDSSRHRCSQKDSRASLTSRAADT